MQEHKLSIYCPHTMKNESVYVHTLDFEDIHLKRFNGCDNYASCPQCADCETKALELYQQSMSDN